MQVSPLYFLRLSENAVIPKKYTYGAAGNYSNLCKF